MEDLLIKKIEGLIRSIKKGIITKEESNIGVFFNKLRPLNKGMYDELLNNYKALSKFK